MNIEFHLSIATTMIRAFLLLAIIACLLSCSEEDDPKGTLQVNVDYDVEGKLYPVSENYEVYLFEGINIHDGYIYEGNGKLKNGNTGEHVNYSQMKKINVGKVMFEGLPIQTHAVAVDMLNSVLKTSRATSINLVTHSGGGQLSFVIDIWPYDLEDV